MVSDEALDEVLVRRDAGRLRQVLGKNEQTFIKGLFLCPKSQGNMEASVVAKFNQAYCVVLVTKPKANA